MRWLKLALAILLFLLVLVIALLWLPIYLVLYLVTRYRAEMRRRQMELADVGIDLLARNEEMCSVEIAEQGEAVLKHHVTLGRTYSVLEWLIREGVVADRFEERVSADGRKRAARLFQLSDGRQRRYRKPRIVQCMWMQFGSWAPEGA